MRTTFAHRPHSPRISNELFFVYTWRYAPHSRAYLSNLVRSCIYMGPCTFPARHTCPRRLNIPPTNPPSPSPTFIRKKPDDPALAIRHNIPQPSSGPCVPERTHRNRPGIRTPPRTPFTEP